MQGENRACMVPPKPREKELVRKGTPVSPAVSRPHRGAVRGLSRRAAVEEGPHVPLSSSEESFAFFY